MYVSYEFKLSTPKNGSTYIGMYISGENLHMNFCVGMIFEKNEILYKIDRIGPIRITDSSHIYQDIYVTNITNAPHENREA